MHKLLGYLISFSIGVFLGIYGCILVKKQSSLTFSKNINFELNPLEVLTLFISVLLAIYVARTVSKKNDLEKSEKELIISYFEDFKTRFASKVSNIIETGSFESPNTNSDFKILRKKLDSILLLASEYNFLLGNDESGTELKNKVRDVWELVTNTPRQVSGRSNQSVRDGIDRLRLEQVSNIETIVIEIEKIIFQITMKIHNK